MKEKLNFLITKINWRKQWKVAGVGAFSLWSEGDHREIHLRAEPQS